MLDKIFDQFEIYASRLNQTAKGTDLIVSISRPSINGKKQEHSLYGEDDEQNKASEIICEGHLTTRFWAMLLRSTVAKVEVFVIPAEMLLAFSTHNLDESSYKPLLILESEWQDGQLIWHIAGAAISIDKAAILAKELFGDLVRVASGKMSESELFAHPMQELSLGENLAMGYQLPAQPSEETVAAPSVMPVHVPANNNDSTSQVNTSVTTVKQSLPLMSPSVSEQLLVSIEQDISQLFELGKSALASEDTAYFKKIEKLTERMEAFKGAVKEGLANVRQAANEKAGD